LSQEHEKNYVSGLYGNNKQKVYDLLVTSCANNSIKNSTHKEVYQHIKDKLGFSLPD